MTKQFAFQQRLVQRRAVDRHETLLRTFAVAMDRTRRELFTRAALTGDKHGRIRRRHFRDEVIDALHRGGFADHVVLDVYI